MDIKTLIHRLIRQYFIIYTGSMIATFCLCSVFYPEFKFPISYLAWMLLFSLFGTLPGLVFYSKKELTKTQWRIRMCLHFLLLEVVLLTAGRLYGMYEGIYNGIWFAFSVFAVYILVRVVSYLLDQRTAELLNKKLKERRRGLK